MSDDGARREVSLMVNVLEAKDLHIQGMNSRSFDPYAAVLVNHREEYRTSTANNTGEPSWDQLVELHAPTDFKSLEVIVWDANRVSKDTPIGKVCLSRQWLTARGPNGVEQWFPLTAADTEGSVSGELNVELFYEPPRDGSPLHTLTVTLLAGRGLVPKDVTGKSDPYVVLHLLPDSAAESTQFSRAALKTVNPKFNQSFTFQFTGDIGDHVLHVSCWDWDRAKADDFMGHFAIPVADLPALCTVNDWFVLLPAPPDRTSDNTNKLRTKQVKLKSKMRKEAKALKAKEAKEGKEHKGRQEVIPDTSLAKNFVIEYQALPAAGTEKTPDRARGSVRLRVIYLEEIILHPDLYSDLILISKLNKFHLPMELGRWASYRDDVARTLLFVYDFEEKVMQFLFDMIDQEVEATTDPNTIFRGNSMASKGIDVFMKLVGSSYLKNLLQGFVQEVITTKKACEVDPSRLSKGEDADKNLKNLESLIMSVINLVLDSVNDVPQLFKEVFAHIRKSVKVKFPDSAQAHHVAVSGFFFLRFICPAILGPKLFNLWNEPIDKKPARILTLVAKVLQNLANLVEFGYKEEFMRPMNQLLLENMDRVKAFVVAISVCDQPTGNRRILDWQTPPVGAIISRKPDYARECLHLFQQLDGARNKIVENGGTPYKQLYERLTEILSHLRERHALTAEALRSRTPMNVSPRPSFGSDSPLASPSTIHRRTVSDSVMPGAHRPSNDFTQPAPQNLTVMSPPTGNIHHPLYQSPANPASFYYQSGGGDSVIVGGPMKASVDGSIPLSEFADYEKRATLRRGASNASDASNVAPAEGGGLVRRPTVTRQNLSRLDAMMADLETAVSSVSSPTSNAPSTASSVAPTPVASTPIPLSALPSVSLSKPLGTPASPSVSSPQPLSPATSVDGADKDARMAAILAAAKARAAASVVESSVSGIDAAGKKTPASTLAKHTRVASEVGVESDEEDEEETEAPFCTGCGDEIGDTLYHSWAGNQWHAEHFTCYVCSKSLEENTFYFNEGRLYCAKDYAATYECAGCHNTIFDVTVEAIGRKWHKECFKCTECSKELDGAFMADEKKNPYCREHFQSREGNHCGKCFGPLDGPSVTFMHLKLHTQCFMCKVCNESLAGKQYVVVDGTLMCAKHLTCFSCNEPVGAQVAFALGRRYHPHHFNCFACKKSLVGQPFFAHENQPYCQDCNNVRR